MRHHGAVSSLDPTDPVPAPEAAPTPDADQPAAPPFAPAAPGGFAFASEMPRGGLGELPPRQGQSRLALYATVLLIVILAFGSGVGVGRVTAPAGEASVTSSAAGSSASPGPGNSLTVGASPSPGSSASPGASDPLAGLPSDGGLLGQKQAKVQVTYWADFQCPFCARFAQDVLPQLASRIADGTVSVLHRDFVFLGPESLDAAIAVHCAGEQGHYWPMHDAVYAAQNGENQGTFSTAKLESLAAGVGADAAAFSACTQRHDVLVSVLADTGAGVRAGVKSTPTIDIPGRTFLGVPDATEFIRAIDAAAAAGTAPTPGPSVQPSGDPWAGTSTSGRTAGPASAPVTVELWVDYQATGMPSMVTNLEPGLRTRAAAGKVQVVLRDLATLGDESVLAASFVRCGASGHEGSVWFVHDILGSSAQGANSGLYTSRTLLWLGAKLGWDVKAADACLADPATASAVTAETVVGTGLGLSAAPAVIVKAGGKEVARFSGSSLDAAKVLAAIDAAGK